MEDDNENIGVEGFTEFAELQIQQISQLNQSFMEQNAALYRWILAARLTINGGAVVALLGQDTIKGDTLIVSILCFFLGILAAILGAELDQFALEKSMKPNITMIAFWVKAKATGKFSSARMDELIAETGNIRRFSLPGKLVGNSSLVFFVLGAIFVGCKFASSFCVCAT